MLAAILILFIIWLVFTDDSDTRGGASRVTP